MAEAFGIDPRLKHSILSRSRSPFPDRLLLFARDQPVVAQRVEKRMLALLDDPGVAGEQRRHVTIHMAIAGDTSPGGCQAALPARDRRRGAAPWP